MLLRTKNSRNLGIELTFILILFLININFISAKNAEKTIDLEYPEKVNYGEEFNINIKFNNFEIDDVSYLKVDILDNNNKRVARIFDDSENKYKSTNYYLDNINLKNDEIKTKINITEDYFGDASIIVSTKDSGGKREKFEEYTIKINGKKDNSKEDNKNSEIIKENNKEKTREEKSEEKNEEKQKEVQEKVIYLNPATSYAVQNTENNILFKSANQKMKEYSIYFFIIFGAIILVCLILKRAKN